MTWRKPYNGHSKITKYFLEYKKSFDLWAHKDVLSVAGNLTKTTVNGLSPGINYHLRITAANQIGESGFSGETSLETKEEGKSLLVKLISQRCCLFCVFIDASVNEILLENA